MALYLRYSDNIQKDILKGVSYHYTDFNKSSYETAEEVAEVLNIPADEVVYNEDAGRWVQELPGLCAFELDSNNLYDAIEEAKEFRFNSVYNSEDMQNWHILDAHYVDDCPEGDVVEVEKVLYSNKEDNKDKFKIISNAEQVLRENYEAAETDITLREYVDIDSDSDPGFFRWLFDDSDIGNFGVNLTREQKEMFEDFLNSL